MPVNPSGAEVLANNLLASLVAGKNFTIPNVDLNDDMFNQPPDGAIEPVVKLTTEDLTTRQVGGSGVFDALMDSINTHLRKEHDAARISGAEFTKAYVGSLQAALGTAAQFLLGKDQAYWQAILVQQQAKIASIEVIKARVELETARAALRRIQYEAATAEANYALTKMKLATEDVTYNNLSIQTGILTSQKTGVDLDNTGKSYTVNQILPIQRALTQEQVEVQRAQTLNTRTDGQLVVGVLGKQKDLYTQQITSYQRDAETKVAKLFTDAWITQKTLNEGLLPPASFKNTRLDKVLVSLMRNNKIGGY